jgi:1-acyl-sn-glycerol-3-phosphate acyltransferase
MPGRRHRALCGARRAPLRAPPVSAAAIRHAVAVIAVQRMVALAMTAYVRGLFRVRTFGLEQLLLEPSTILAPSHRSDNDVPLLVSALAPRWTEMVAGGLPWPTFAADDHAFFRGFLAGYPADIPLALRRAVWPIRVGGVLERRLQCVPVRLPAQMRLVELLRFAPEEPLDGRLPPGLDAALRRRADELGRPAPTRAGDVLDGAFADLLWTLVERDHTSNCDEIWRAHLRSAVGDFRRLVGTLRSGGVVVIFPEGELSEDGRVGPLQPGLVSLARRGRVRRVQPVAISYDPLTRGRTRAYVSIAVPIEPSPRTLERQVTSALRRAIPLTAGQIAAAVLRDGGSARGLYRAGAEWVRRAEAERRPIEPLLRGHRRRLVLEQAFGQARGRGAEHDLVRRLAQELESAHSSS